MRTEERFSRDRLTNVDHGAVASGVMRIVDAFQNERKEVQVAASGILFHLVCERFGLSPRETHTIIDNILNHSAGRRKEYTAARLYMQNEWK